MMSKRTVDRTRQRQGRQRFMALAVRAGPVRRRASVDASAVELARAPATAALRFLASYWDTQIFSPCKPGHTMIDDDAKELPDAGAWAPT